MSEFRFYYLCRREDTTCCKDMRWDWRLEIDFVTYYILPYYVLRIKLRSVEDCVAPLVFWILVRCYSLFYVGCWIQVSEFGRRFLDISRPVRRFYPQLPKRENVVLCFSVVLSSAASGSIYIYVLYEKGLLCIHSRRWLENLFLASDIPRHLKLGAEGFQLYGITWRNQHRVLD